jgi:transcriptional regulator with XRE-family HTH domain
VKRTDRIRDNRRQQYDTPTVAEVVCRIATNVAGMRVQRQWTQAETAKRCSMSLRLYQRIEGEEANLTVTTICRLCDGFNVDITRILRRPEDADDS